MKITLDIPEEEYKRYKQYYDSYIIKECPHLTCTPVKVFFDIVECEECGKLRRTYEKSIS